MVVDPEDVVLDPEMNLTKTEWDILEEIEEVLEPFMLVQRVLEGQKYVTLSFVAYVINAIRKNVKEMIMKSRSDDMRTVGNKAVTSIKSSHSYICSPSPQLYF